MCSCGDLQSDLKSSKSNVDSRFMPKVILCSTYLYLDAISSGVNDGVAHAPAGVVS